MKNFWGYIKNEKFAVGCTGQTVYVYDTMGNELAKFKDIIYAYTPMFCPGKNIFIVKSTVGNLAVYSLDTLELIKKFRFSKVAAAQDDGFCFSHDGKLLYNIERHIDSLITHLSIYDTSNFERLGQLFNSDTNQVLSHIEYDNYKKALFVLGYTRDKKQSEWGFAAELLNNELKNITRLSADTHSFIRGYKRLELLGFTAKAKEWSSLKYHGYDLCNIESIPVHLSDYIELK